MGRKGKSKHDTSKERSGASQAATHSKQKDEKKKEEIKDTEEKESASRTDHVEATEGMSSMHAPVKNEKVAETKMARPSAPEYAKDAKNEEPIVEEKRAETADQQKIEANDVQREQPGHAFDTAISDKVADTQYFNDYSFSLKHFLSSKSNAKELGLYKYVFVISPDGQFVYRTVLDIYGGKSFKDRLDFFLTREIAVARLFIEGTKLRMQMDTKVIKEDGGYTHWLTDQEVFADRSVIMTLLDKNTITTGRIWQNKWREFNFTDSMTVLPTEELGEGVVLPKRSVRTFFNQGLYKPFPAQYFRDCLLPIQDLYDRFSDLNLAGNFYVINFNNKDITSEKNIGLMHPTSDDKQAARTLLSFIATKISKFRNFMYIRIKSVIMDMISIKAGASTQNVAILADNLNLVLNNVGMVNAVPSSVFSTDAATVFTTFAGGCCMNNVFKFTFDINPFGAVNLTTIMSCFMYLIFTPTPLMHAGTVDAMKTYLYRNLLGSFMSPTSRNNGADEEVGAYTHFDPDDPDNSSIERFAFEGPPLPRGKALSAIYPSWERFMEGDYAGAVADFFRYDFISQMYNEDGDLVLYAGRFDRFALMLNLLNSVISFNVYHYALTNVQRNQLVGLARAILNQYIPYGQFVIYLTNVVNLVRSLNLCEFSIPQKPENLDMDYNKFLAVTTKLNLFEADFKTTWFKIVAWAGVVIRELGLLVCIYRFYWNRAINNYYCKILISRGELEEFVTPIINLYKVYMTTDISKMIFEQFPMYMKSESEQPQDDLLAFDFLEIFTQIPLLRDEFKVLEKGCGYTSSVTFNTPASLETGEGLSFKLLSDDLEDTIVKDRIEWGSMWSPGTLTIITQDEDYPCFRVTPKWIEGTSDVLIDESPRIIKDIREGNKIVDVPLYIRWQSNSHLYDDLIVAKPPLILPTSAPSLELVTVPDLGFGETSNIEYYNTALSDVLFTGSEHFDQFFDSKRIR